MKNNRYLSRFLYRFHFDLEHLLWMPKPEGVSVFLVTWNRAAFLNETLRTLAETLPAKHEVLLWNNASTDRTHQVVDHWKSSRLHLTAIHSRQNIGTAAYAKLALRAKYRWFVVVDDDVLHLPPDWTRRMITALRSFPGLEYLSLDVVQDKFTDGNRPSADHYFEQSHLGTVIDIGPAGGWTAMISRAFYFSTGGFPYRPQQPDFCVDGFLNRRTRELGKRSGILKNVRVYHATGPAWAAAAGAERLGSNPQGPDRSQESALPDLNILNLYRNAPLGV